jgi:phage tail-like protein
MSSRRLIYGLVAVLLLVVATVAAIAAPASSNARAPASSSQTGAARFALVVGGREVAVFSDLVGLTAGYDAEELEVDQKETILDLPRTHTPPTVVLRRGMTSNRDLWDWHNDALQNGSRAWRDAELVMFDYDGTPVARWRMVNAWPSKLEINTLSAGGQEVAMETVTIVHEHMERVAP